MNKSAVEIVKGTQAQAMVEQALSLLGGVEALIKPHSSVVVQSNAGHFFGPETSVNTSPALVKAVIRTIRQAKPAKIILAGASAIGTDTFECLEISGIKQSA